MGRRLRDREHLVERVQVGQLALAPGPGQPLRRLERGAPSPTAATVASSRRAVVGQQLVDPGVHARADRTVRRQQSLVGQPAHPAQRAEVVARAAAPIGTGSKPIDGVMCGSTWSPANSSAGGARRGRPRARGCVRAWPRRRSVRSAAITVDVVVQPVVRRCPVGRVVRDLAASGPRSRPPARSAPAPAAACCRCPPSGRRSGSFSIAIVGCSPAPRLTWLPNSRRTATAIA